jgi:phosphoribosylanthranilate isomerase
VTRAKVCGLTGAPDVDAAVRAGADALGFIVDVPVDTPRELSSEHARELVVRAPPFVTTVLVTMPESPAAAADLHARVGADAVQVHDGLTPEEVAALGETTGAATVAATGPDPDEAARFDAAADALLVDSAGAAGGGGTGRTHDWTVTREVVERVESPVVLAGGLTPGNVAEAAATVEPYAVDVATGVEAEPGEKDHDAVRAFVAEATA